MKTFDLSRTIHGVGDLSDGVLIALCLKNMFVESIVLDSNLEVLFFSDANHFNETWVQKLRTDAGDNYRVKVIVQISR